LKVIASNAHWFWFCASSHDMSRKLLVEISMLLYQTFWVQVLLKFLISDDELNKELVKNNAFMFFDFDFIEISDFKSRFFFRNFWFLLSFLSSSSDFAIKISDFNFWFELCSLFLYRLHVDSKINELWTNVMSLHKANHMSVF